MPRLQGPKKEKVLHVYDHEVLYDGECLTAATAKIFSEGDYTHVFYDGMKQLGEVFQTDMGELHVFLDN
jgi:hypothetical protein